MLVGEPDGDDDVRGAMRISDGLYMSRSPELLRRVLEPEPPPRARLVMGYSGWGVGQLEAELEASAWLLSDVDPDLIFNTPAERIWEAAIRRLGADPATLQMSRGVH
jgi:putative transcriptional regulator